MSVTMNISLEQLEARLKLLDTMAPEAYKYFNNLKKDIIVRIYKWGVIPAIKQNPTITEMFNNKWVYTPKGMIPEYEYTELKFYVENEDNYIRRKISLWLQMSKDSTDGLVKISEIEYQEIYNPFWFRTYIDILTDFT